MDISYTLNKILFVWDSEKATQNFVKHNLSLETACEIFFDPFLQTLKDEEVDGEMRQCVLGMTLSWQLLYVVYTFRSDSIRLISARQLTNAERKQYEGY